MAGLIREIVTPVDGVGSVTNGDDWLTSEGADEETDALLYERYRLQWQAQSGVTSAAYQFAALSVPGVMGVKVDAQHPRGQGTIDVIILGADGEPTDALLLLVEAAIKEAIIINDDVLVKKVLVKQHALKLTIEYLTGKAEDIKTAAEVSIREKVTVTSQNIGADLILARVISDVINMAGVKRVVWEEPTEDVVVENDEIFKLSTLDITMKQVSDE